jgi:hypothetical protein
VFPVARNEFGLPYFRPADVTEKFVESRCFGGLVGRGWMEEPEHAGRVYVFPREDTLNHAYN